MSDTTITLLVIAAVLIVGAFYARQRWVYKAKHRRTLSDMYQPAPKVNPPPSDDSESS